MSVLCRILVLVGLIQAALAQGCSYPEGGPNMSLKESDLESFPEGITVTFVCNTGYVPSGGTGSITCSAGSWSNVRLSCSKFNCGSAGELANGNIDYSEGTLFGAKIVMTCNKGYTLVGRSELFCGDKGWLGRLPVCEVVKCVTPGVVANGDFLPKRELYDYRTVVQYTCKESYTLNGTRTRTCSADGEFQPGPPICTKVDCLDPDIDNGMWISGSRPPHGYLATLTLACNNGFQMVGVATQQCDINSRWTPGLPRCQLPGGDGDEKPGNGKDVPRTLGIVFGVLFGLAVITASGCYCFGVPSCISRKTAQRSPKSPSDSETPKDPEAVTLS